MLNRQKGMLSEEENKNKRIQEERDDLQNRYNYNSYSHISDQ